MTTTRLVHHEREHEHLPFLYTLCEECVCSGTCFCSAAPAVQCGMLTRRTGPSVDAITEGIKSFVGTIPAICRRDVVASDTEAGCAARRNDKQRRAGAHSSRHAFPPRSRALQTCVCYPILSADLARCYQASETTHTRGKAGESQPVFLLGIVPVGCCTCWERKGKRVRSCPFHACHGIWFSAFPILSGSPAY